jgi:hypothetical protein
MLAGAGSADQALLYNLAERGPNQFSEAWVLAFPA